MTVISLLSSDLCSSSALLRADLPSLLRLQFAMPEVKARHAGARRRRRRPRRAAPRRGSPGRDERRGAHALGDLLQSALPTLEGDGGAQVGADELARALSVVGAASAEDCAAIVECLDGDGYGDGAITIEEFRGSWPTCSRSNLRCYTYTWKLERFLVCCVPVVFIYDIPWAEQHTRRKRKTCKSKMLQAAAMDQSTGHLW